MKKIITVLLTIALVLAGISSISIFGEDENVALGKKAKAYAQSPAGAPAMDNPFFKTSYITDGIAPVWHEGETDVHIGWIGRSPSQEDDLYVIVDLGAKYAISKIILSTLGFQNGDCTPSEFDILIADSYETIDDFDTYSGEVDVGGRTEAFEYSKKAAARYVCIYIYTLGEYHDASNYYAGFGEIEVYGHEFTDADIEVTASPTPTQTPDPTVEPTTEIEETPVTTPEPTEEPTPSQTEEPEKTAGCGSLISIESPLFIATGLLAFCLKKKKYQ